MDIIQDIRAGKISPVYLLHGEEIYYVQKILYFFENQLLTPEQASFNLNIFYGKDTDVMQLLDTARQYPLMSQIQLIIVKEAQDLRRIEDLQAYIERPVSSTILVLAYMHKKLDLRTKFAQTIKEHAIIYESKPIRDYQVADFVKEYIAEKKRSIDAETTHLIAENLGNNLTKIANELDKIFINLPEKSQINMDAVQKYIGISKEYNIFELQRALGERDSKKAYTILNNFSQNIKKNPLVVVIGSLNTYFSKIFMSHFLKNVSEKEFVSTLSLTSEFFIKEYKTAQQRYPLPKVETIISLLKEYDLKSKGINNDGQPDEALMKELVVKILNV